MVVAPDILRQVEGQPLSPDAPFGHQTALEVAPEAFQPVDVAPAPIAERLGIVHQPVDVAPRCNAGVAGEGIRADGGARPHPMPSAGPELDGRSLAPGLSASNLLYSSGR